MYCQKVLRLALLFLQIVLSAQGINCPNLEKYDNPQNFYKYIVQNMIVIPKTNILIINTMQQTSSGSSYVYYIDLVSAQIINTIKPSYQIVNMMYHQLTDQIVVQNKGSLLMTDPYTLNVLKSFSGFNFSKLELIEGTNYIIVSLFYNQCWVVDVSKQISVFQMDNYYNLDTFPDSSSLLQYITKFFILSTGQKIVVISNDRGLISWTIDFNTFTYLWNSYINPSIVRAQGDNYWSFSKHPTKDILFLVGAYQQILVLQIVDIVQGKFNTLYNKSLNDYSQQNEFFINLNYIVVDGQDIFVTCLGDYLHKFNVNFSSDFTSLTINETGNEWVSSYNQFFWTPYQQMNFIFIPSGSYVSIYNYKEEYMTYIFYFYGNRYNRRFVSNYDGETQKIVLLDNNQLKLFDRKNFGYYPYDSNKQKPNLSYNQIDDYAIFYQVRYTTNKYFVKTSDGIIDYLTIFQIYPLDSIDTSIDIHSKYGQCWISFGSVLDPFFFNNAIWVGMPEPYKSNQNYIISLLNCQSGDIVYLKSGGDDTSIQTSFGLASLDDPNNQEYIAFDNLGNIYIWDLSKPNFPFKFSLNFNDYLKNSQGDIIESNATLNQMNSNQEGQEKEIDFKQFFNNEMKAMQSSKQGQMKLQIVNNKSHFNQTESIQLENCACNQLQQSQKQQDQKEMSSQIKQMKNDNNLIQFDDQIESIYSENQDDRVNTGQYFIDSNKFLIDLQPKRTFSDINYQNQNAQAKSDQQTLVYVEEGDEIQYTKQDQQKGNLNEQNEQNLKSRSPDNTENNTQRNQFTFDSKINLLKDKQSDHFDKKSQNQDFKKAQNQQQTILEEDIESLQHKTKQYQNVNRCEQLISIIEEKNNPAKREPEIYTNKLIPGQNLTDTKLDLHYYTQNVINLQNSQDLIYEQDIEVQVNK
ncbi:hypothetical protein ABPG72_016653 [Tetrahymena utriculariae]